MAVLTPQGVENVLRVFRMQLGSHMKNPSMDTLLAKLEIGLGVNWIFLFYQ